MLFELEDEDEDEPEDEPEPLNTTELLPPLDPPSVTTIAIIIFYV